MTKIPQAGWGEALLIGGLLVFVMIFFGFIGSMLARLALIYPDFGVILVVVLFVWFVLALLVRKGVIPK